jgi:hypothetical protein
MTPIRADDFTTKNMITLRDGVLILLGALGMYGTQLATQYGMRSDLRDLLTRLENYQVQQNDTNSSLQRQIDEWPAETKLNRVNLENADKATAELKGMLLGAGIKGVSK